LIAKLSPNIFICRAKNIIQFILETLLPYDINENDGKYPENKSIKTKKIKTNNNIIMTPMIFESKQCAIQILVNYLLSIVDLSPHQIGINSSRISPIKKSTQKSKKNDKPKQDDNDDIQYKKKRVLIIVWN